MDPAYTDRQVLDSTTGPHGHALKKAEKVNVNQFMSRVKESNNGVIPVHSKHHQPLSVHHTTILGEDEELKLVSDRDLGPTSSYRWAPTWSWPFQCVGNVLVYNGGQEGWQVTKVATGVMVGRRVMLTASHIMPRGGGEGELVVDSWAIKFIPGVNFTAANSANFGSSWVAEYHYITDSALTAGLPSGNDIAVCALEDALGDRCGWWGSESRGYAVDYENPPTYSSVGYYQD